jgi:geranylgeranyl diphosphate synthase type II
MDKIDHAIRSHNQGWSSQPPVNLYEPVAYAMSAGGKRIRPLLVLLGCQLFSDEVDNALPAALAIEVFHNFTLLHDDIMDHADMRRGRPTVHRQFSANAAILSGDAMAFLAYKLLLESRTEKMEVLTSLFTRTALEVCEGQQYDMDFETRMEVSTAEYIEMIRLKTAVLLGCALKAGAVCGEADDEAADEVYQIGINLGLAFQLQDDLLDTYGSESEFGKKIGGDISANKKTYLLITALEMASPEVRQELTGWITRKEFSRDEKVRAVRNIYDLLNIREKTELLIQSYIRETIDLLGNLPVKDSRKEQLREICLKLTNRNS